MNLKKCEFHKNMREKINLSIFLLAVGKNGKLVCTETLDEKKLLHMKVRILHEVNTLAKGCYSYCKSYTQFPFTDISFRIIFYALVKRDSGGLSSMPVTGLVLFNGCIANSLPSAEFCGCTIF